MRCSFLECWSTPDKNVTFIKSVHSWLEHQLSIIFIRNLGWNYNPAELTQNFIKETQGIKIWELNLAHSVIVLVRTWACDLMFWNFQGFQYPNDIQIDLSTPPPTHRHSFCWENLEITTKKTRRGTSRNY